MQAAGTLSMTPKGTSGSNSTPLSVSLRRQWSTTCMAESQSSMSVTMGNMTRSGPFCGGTHEGADLNCHLGQIAQAAADAPQAQLEDWTPDRRRPWCGQHRSEGAHRHHPALGGGEAGGVEQILLLLVHGVAGHHHVAAAQQAHARTRRTPSRSPRPRGRSSWPEARILRRPGCGWAARAGRSAPRSGAASRRCR